MFWQPARDDCPLVALTLILHRHYGVARPEFAQRQRDPFSRYDEGLILCAEDDHQSAVRDELTRAFIPCFYYARVGMAAWFKWIAICHRCSRSNGHCRCRDRAGIGAGVRSDRC